MPPPEIATRIRHANAGQPLRVDAILAAAPLRAAFPAGLAGDSYKRMPRGFDEATPHPDLIKLKSFTFWNEEPAQAVGGDVAESIVDRLKTAIPWVAFLRDALRLPT